MQNKIFKDRNRDILMNTKIFCFSKISCINFFFESTISIILMKNIRKKNIIRTDFFIFAY